jgi:hypothetical protein
MILIVIQCFFFKCVRRGIANRYKFAHALPIKVNTDLS